MTDDFHRTHDGNLDRKYLRVCAVYRLLIRHHIGKARGLALLAARKVPHAPALMELWQSNSIRDMLP